MFNVLEIEWRLGRGSAFLQCGRKAARKEQTLVRLTREREREKTLGRGERMAGRRSSETSSLALESREQKQ